MADCQQCDADRTRGVLQSSVKNPRGDKSEEGGPHDSYMGVSIAPTSTFPPTPPLTQLLVTLTGTQRSNGALQESPGAWWLV